MTLGLIEIITSRDDAVRNRSLDGICRAASFSALLEECAALDTFRRQSENLYERVRALFFLYAIHRFHLPERVELKTGGQIPFSGYGQFLPRPLEQALEIFSPRHQAPGPTESLGRAPWAADHRQAPSQP